MTPRKNKNPKGIGSWSQSEINGKVRYRWTIMLNGKTKSLSSYDKNELERRVQAFLDKTHAFKFDPVKNCLDDLAMLYLERATANVKQKTRDFYAQTYGRYVKGSRLGRLHLKEVTALELDLFFDELSSKKKLSPATVQGVRRVIRIILNYAIVNEFLTVNNARFAKGPRLKPRRMQPLTDEQMGFIVKVAHAGAYDSKFCGQSSAHDMLKKCFECALLLTIFTGLRWGETFGLTWDKVDFTNFRLNIDQALANNSLGHYLDDPKSSARYVPAPPFLMDALQKWLEYLNNYAKLMGNLFVNDLDLVFPNSIGGFINYTNFRKRFWNPLKIAAKLPKGFRWHDLRHNYASILSHNGLAPADLAATLGHSSEYVSCKYYTHRMSGYEDKVKELLIPYADIMTMTKEADPDE